jgi:WD40 repeat protein
MLQRAWNPNPQALPFAPYIKTHALVSLVQKGLQYHDIEQSLDKACPELGRADAAMHPDERVSNQDIQEGHRIPPSSSNLFFGPAPLPQETVKTRDEHHGKVQDGPGTDPASLSPGSKAGARDNNTTNGTVATEAAVALPTPNDQPSRKSDQVDATPNGDESAMEIDSNGLAHDRVSGTPGIQSPSPADHVVDADGDVGMGMGIDMGMGMGMGVGVGVDARDDDEEPQQAEPTFTLTTGKSVGVQSSPAKTPELSASTAIVAFEVARDDHVTRLEWCPRDPSIFAASCDSVTGVWKLPSPNSPPGAAPTHEIIFDSRGDGTWVTALTWDPTGQKLAVATFNEMRGSIQTYDAHGAAVDLLPEAPGMITGLYWAPSGSRMIVASSNGANSELALWDDAIKPEELSPHQAIDGEAHDIAWAGDGHVVASGEGSVWLCDVDSSVHLVKKFTSDSASTEWSWVRGTTRASVPVGVAIASTTASIWVPTHDMRVDDVHRGDITAIDLRPEPRDQDSQIANPLVLATCSIDDTVKIWNINVESRQITCLHTLFLTPGLPALALAFSPDGYAVSAASTDKVFIWNVDRGGQPLATWTKPSANELKEEGVEKATNGTGLPDELPFRSLAWDMDGKKLVMGFGKKVVLISRL